MVAAIHRSAKWPAIAKRLCNPDLKAVLYPIVLEISVFGIKLPDISSVR